ncbi:hypothetical protein SRHO_G00173040 [Serrasalmus rhombeus]
MRLGIVDGLKRHAVASLNLPTQPIYCLAKGAYLSNRKKMYWVGQSLQKIKCKLISSSGSGRKHSASGVLLSSSRLSRCLLHQQVEQADDEQTLLLSRPHLSSVSVDLKVYFLN